MPEPPLSLAANAASAALMSSDVRLLRSLALLLPTSLPTLLAFFPLLGLSWAPPCFDTWGMSRDVDPTWQVPWLGPVGCVRVAMADGRFVAEVRACSYIDDEIMAAHSSGHTGDMVKLRSKDSLVT